jgi:hypothetical protein
MTADKRLHVLNMKILIRSLPRRIQHRDQEHQRAEHDDEHDERNARRSLGTRSLIGAHAAAL